MKKIELLAPAGSMSKLKTAIYYGADAVYVGGKAFSLRAFSTNFTNEELFEAVNFVHNAGKKIYITVNIFAKNSDFESAKEYFLYLQNIGVDGVIITDLGLISLCSKIAPKLEIHLSTQANTLNKYAVETYASLGVKRVVLARELSLKEIKEIKEYNPDMELETFVHGAMCISFSGRCLLSNYLNGRDSNRGECVQACRWEYAIREKSKDGDFYPIEEDERGTYILNSKDLNMIDYISEMADSGICSLKIEGRMKGEYYLATVINAYRRAIDEYYKVGKEYKNNSLYNDELLKTAHRAFTTAYMLGENSQTVNYLDSQSQGNFQFIANVLGYDEKRGAIVVEMRNRFKVGDILEVLSPTDNFNKIIKVTKIENAKGEEVFDAKLVQEKLYIYSDTKLYLGDILRKSVK